MRPVLRGAALGLVLGAAWGAAARGWMRLVSTEPEFSWEGTLMIIGLAAFLGLLVGAVTSALRHGRSGWWRVAVLPGLLLFMSPGMVMLPGCVVGGLAAARRTPRGWLVAVGAAAVVPVVMTFTAASGDPVRVRLWLLVGMTALTLVLAWGWRDLFARAPGRASAARPDGRAALAEEDPGQLTASRASTTPSPK
jgi:hypothetical protein